MKTRPVGAELLHAACVIHGKANSRFSQFCERGQKKKLRSHRKTRDRKLRSGVNWQGEFKQDGVKRGSYKYASLFILMY
jgi:hypothetical protein